MIEPLHYCSCATGKKYERLLTEKKFLLVVSYAVGAQWINSAFHPQSCVIYCTALSCLLGGNTNKLQKGYSQHQPLQNPLWIGLHPSTERSRNKIQMAWPFEFHPFNLSVFIISNCIFANNKLQCSCLKCLLYYFMSNGT